MSVQSYISSSSDEQDSPSQLVVANYNSQCLVCGELGLHKHFGTRTCNSCAAFFRRTVFHRKRYNCLQSQACNVTQTRNKNRCAFCRFEKCLMIGMKTEKVVDDVSAFLNEGENSMLNRLRLWHRGTFISRRKHYIELYGFRDFYSAWEKPRNAQSFARASAVESYVMRDFLRNTGMIEYDYYNSQFETVICSELFFMWMLLEFIFQTKLHGGQRSKKVYYVDDSYLQFNEDVVYDYFRTHSNFSSPTILCKSAMLTMESVLDTTEKIHRCGIDDHEKMAIFLICLLNKAKRNVPIPKTQEWLNAVFCDLKKHYDNTYHDMTRLDQIMTCVTAIESTQHIQLQQIAVTRLDYKEINSTAYDCYSAQLFSKRN